MKFNREQSEETELDHLLAELPLLDLPEDAAGRQEAAALACLARRRRRRRRPPALARAGEMVARFGEWLLVLLLGGGYLLSAICRALTVYGVPGVP